MKNGKPTEPKSPWQGLGPPLISAMAVCRNAKMTAAPRGTLFSSWQPKFNQLPSIQETPSAQLLGKHQGDLGLIRVL